MKKITIMNSHLGVGGIEKYVSGLTRMLDGQYEIELLITYKLKENPTYPISSKAKITYIIDEYTKKSDIKKAFNRKKIFTLIKEIFKRIKIDLLKKVKTRRAIKKLDTDYIITTRMYETKLVNKLLKKSNIVKIATDHNDLDKKHVKKVIKATTHYDRLVLMSEEIKNIYKKEIGDKAVCLNNFIADSLTKKANLKNKNLISVGKLSKEKDFISLLEIMSLIVKEDPEVSLTLIGDGKESKKIKDKIKELSLENNVNLTGYLSASEIEDYMLKSSVFVMTSTTESFGISILEAMNASLPVVAFNTSSGAKELLKDGIGVLIPNRDKEAFSNAVLNLLNNKKELSDLSKKSKEKAANYYLKEIKKDFISLLEECKIKSNKKVMFISSTGGHLNEMLMLKSMFKKYPFMLVTENTKTNTSLKEKYGKRNVKFLIYGTRKHIVIYPFKLIINCFISLYYFIKFRPKYIVTTGAHTAGPMCCIGKLFRSKIIYIESFANSETKTVTGRIIYKFADLFIVQWESMLSLYDKAVYGGWIY